MSRVAIGIDLGTTYARLATFEYENIQIIPNLEGNRRIPSYVTLNNTECFVGQEAKNQERINPYNTIYNAKRFIGRKFDDQTVRDDMKYWPFQVINEGGRPKVQVEYKHEQKSLTAEEISSMILIELKAMAENYLEKKVSDAVISVPAYFNDTQRQATIDAGIIAGFNVIRLINETTAAVIAHALNEKVSYEQNILIFHMGGGTFDVSIVRIEEDIFEVLSTSGQTHLGGEDFNYRMMEYFIQQFQDKYDQDLRKNEIALQRLRIDCEYAKHTLSSSYEAFIQIESLHHQIDFDTKITRIRFEEICDDLFLLIIEHLEKVLYHAKIDQSQIHQLLLTGGSTSIPKIQKLFKDFFYQNGVSCSILSDESVACGAAICAALAIGDRSERIKNILVLDVTSYSIGIEIAGGLMSPLIKRNTIIPTVQREMFTTYSHNGAYIFIKVYEGECSMIKDNRLVASFEPVSITAAPRGVPQIQFTFQIDFNGILIVSAEDHTCGRIKKCRIQSSRSNLSKDQIERIIFDVELFKKERHEQYQRKILFNDILSI